MKPPFSYYGGKQRIVRHIIPHIPKHTVYVEPFCGGATLLFEKHNYFTSNSCDYREVLNDTNKDVHNFFVQLRDNGSELCRLLELSIYSRTEYELSKKYKGEDPLIEAYYFYVNIMQSFNNKLNGGWGTHKFKSNNSITYKNKTDNLHKYIERMRTVFIDCEDATKCIKRWDSPHTFFYCDPPYPGAHQGHYAGYTQEDFERLVDTLDNCEGSFILSCYHNDAVPNEWEKVEIETFMSASTDKSVNRKRTECIWIREAKGKCRPEINSIYEKHRQLDLFG